MRFEVMYNDSINMNILMGIKRKLKSSLFLSKRLRRLPPYYNQHRKLLFSLQSASLNERMHKSHMLLKKVTLQASSSRYAKRIGSPSNFDEWKMTDKAALRDFGHEMRVNRLFPSIGSYSGGTTGVPIHLRLSLGSVALEQALIDFLCEKAGLDWYASKVAVLRGDDSLEQADEKCQISHLESNGRRMHFYSNRIGESSLDKFLSTIREYSPNILWVYPSMLSQFFRLLGNDEHSITPTLIFSSSESLAPELFERAAKAFPDASIIDFYGQAERACAAYALAPEEYYFVAAYGFVELIFERHDGEEDLYQIVATPYWNRSFGLVRLKTGDLARVSRGTDEKGLLEISLGLSSFLGVSGRADDFLLSPSGEMLVGIDHIHKGNSKIERLQVVQRSINKVDLFVISVGEFDSVDEMKLMSSARKKIPQSIDVKVHRVDKLRKSKNGKTPFVIREFFD